MALLIYEMVKAPLEAAGAVGLMLTLVVTMQWQVVPAVLATVAVVKCTSAVPQGQLALA